MQWRPSNSAEHKNKVIESIHDQIKTRNPLKFQLTYTVGCRFNHSETQQPDPQWVNLQGPVWTVMTLCLLVSNNPVCTVGWTVNIECPVSLTGVSLNLLHHLAAAAPGRTQYTMFSPAGWKRSPCWVRPGVGAGAAPRLSFHCSWLTILLPRSARECSRLGFLLDIMFYCSTEAISVSPCLADMQCGVGVTPGSTGSTTPKKRRKSSSNRRQTAASQRGGDTGDITASVTGQVSNRYSLQYT